MVLDRPLVAPGDDQDVGYTGDDGFLNNILDDRLVHDREHLLGLGLGHREKTCPEARSGDHDFPDTLFPFHSTLKNN